MTENAAEMAKFTRLDDVTLRNIATFDDALALVNTEFGGELLAADKEIGNGFTILDKKDSLIGEMFIILGAGSHKSDYASRASFWSLQIVTKSGRKLIVNDGGSGIAEQMDVLSQVKPEIFSRTAEDDGHSILFSMTKPMIVRKGLRVSRYTHPEHGESATYYLDTSAE